MARVVFTQNLARHVACPDATADGSTVREVLDRVFEASPALRGYVLDERGELRQHMTIFVDGATIVDRRTQSDPVGTDAEIHVLQSLSGG